MSSKTFLAMDMGAGTLRAAEFEPTSSGVRLVRFGVKPLGLEGASERARPKALEKAITELFDEAGFQGKDRAAGGSRFSGSFQAGAHPEGGQHQGGAVDSV